MRILLFLILGFLDFCIFHMSEQIPIQSKEDNFLILISKENPGINSIHVSMNFINPNQRFEYTGSLNSIYSFSLLKGNRMGIVKIGSYSITFEDRNHYKNNPGNLCVPNNSNFESTCEDFTMNYSCPVLPINGKRKIMLHVTIKNTFKSCVLPMGVPFPILGLDMLRMGEKKINDIYVELYEQSK